MSSSLSNAHGHFIGGRDTASSSGATFEVVAPADSRVLGHAARGDTRDADVAVSAATAAFHPWANLAPAERERILLRCADALESHRDAMIDLVIDESGSTISKARYEVDYSASLMRAAAGESRRLFGETLPHERPTRLSMVVREPVGVVLVISPFNAALALLIKMVAFPLAAGNTVVAKPSEETPLVALAAARIFHEAGLPAGVFNVVAGFGAEIGEALVQHRGIHGLALTGSTATGRRIGVAAIERMRALQLELGGKNALVILKDFEAEAAAAIAADGAYYHAGQICMANSRIFVERGATERFVEAFKARAEGLNLGDLRNESTAYGPLINPRALAKVEAHVSEARALGARVVTGGRVRSGLVYEPTILLEPPPSSATWCDETFGPVANVVEVKDLSDAIARANASDYGLSGAILTHDLRQGLTAARQLRCGGVHIGTHPFQSNALAPIGGYGMSGFGRSGGRWSVEAFTEAKWISIETGTPPLG